MRIFFQYILPIVATLAIYVAWLVLQGKGKKLPHWNEGPWFWLIVAGFVLGGASLITFGVSGLSCMGVKSMCLFILELLSVFFAGEAFQSDLA